MVLRFYPFRLLALVSCAVAARSAIAIPQCSTTVEGTFVAGAVVYELYTSVARYCDGPCGGSQQLFIQPEPRYLVATSATPLWTVESAPAFDGVWLFVARNAAGSAIASQPIGAPFARSAQGRPYLGTAAVSVDACMGEQITFAPKLSPSGVEYQWYRDGVPISGATQSSLTLDIDASDDGAVLTCAATNLCGTSVAGPFLVTVVEGVAKGAVDWQRCSEWESVTQSGGSFWWCSNFGVSTARQGSCNANWTSLMPNSMNCVIGGGLAGDGTRGVTVAFELASPTMMHFVCASNPVPCVSSSYDRANAALTGPVNVNLKPTATGGSGSIALLPGTYAIEGSIWSGSRNSCSHNCCCCGPTCQTICWQCNAWGSMSLGLTFTPIIFDVPGVYPTIQAAIDAVPAGEARTITVAPGIFNEVFALNGKDVVMQGSTLAPTILDGTGLTTSIATFTGDEPPTAGLERLVFRDGVAGQAIDPPQDNRTGGGAVFGRDSAAFIRDCVFEHNAAQFGGAVLALRSSFDVDGCNFIQNESSIDGGAILTIESSGSMRDSTWSGNRCGSMLPGSSSAIKSIGAREAGGVVVIESCSISGNPIPVRGSAVGYDANEKTLAGTMLLRGTDIVSNHIEEELEVDAAGVRIVGPEQSCVLAKGAVVCANVPRNVLGPYRIEGEALVCCAADLSGDGDIGAPDLAIMLANWGASAIGGEGDLNRDGFVNSSDLSALFAAWGGPCSD